jgi:chitin deacetylase
MEIQWLSSSPTGMQEIARDGGHIAVHTWSHPYSELWFRTADVSNYPRIGLTSVTSLSNEDVMSELGWTMQIISDLNGGRIPRYWRPPFGDVDNRVRAIAKGVFGLETVPWNQGEFFSTIPSDHSSRHAKLRPSSKGLG